MTRWTFGIFVLALLACAGVGKDGKNDSSGESTPAGTDADQDGYTTPDDCDDGDASVHPGAAEVCDGADNDCNGEADEFVSAIYYTDADGDSYGDSVSAQAGCPPSSTGYATRGGDCDDADASVSPDGVEECNGVDDDCDGTADDGVTSSWWFPDADGDGYGSTMGGTKACANPGAYVSDSSDCNDASAATHPGATEVCDDADNDCDTEVDEDAVGAPTWYTDSDYDGYGDPSGPTTEACDQPRGYAGNTDDCDDSTASISPAATETCNGLDDDCDGAIDGTSLYGTFYRDADGDGYGDPTATTRGCIAPDGYVTDGTDCDDTDGTIHPTATDDWYDGVDANCDGADDYDYDADGYESDAYGGTDCNDRNDRTYPGAPDAVYDGVDSDCSGGSDYDADGDGYESAAYGGTDCDDTRSDVYPGAPETDAKRDHDCDGRIEVAPVAVATVDTSASRLQECLPAFLDGTDSYDPDGVSVTYAWDVDSVPALSTVTAASLQSATDASPTVFLDLAGTYVFSLVVTDVDGNVSPADTVSVTVGDRTVNTAPTAHAGADQTATDAATCTPIAYGTGGYDCDSCPTATFTLDGGGSSDAELEELSYAWVVSSGAGTLTATSGSGATLSVDGPTPTSPTDIQSATVEVQLRVTDCFGATSIADTVAVQYTCSGK